MKQRQQLERCQNGNGDPAVERRVQLLDQARVLRLVVSENLGILRPYLGQGSSLGRFTTGGQPRRGQH